ncbi:MAG: hypothetical protein P4L42_14835 [Desulfocapsaceae bacterium]|nr:hypothetical protein [Desulfocapsaceae bacterium]
MSIIIQELGRLLDSAQAARETGIDARRLRKYYRIYGGFRLDAGSGPIRFYEKELLHAIQGQIRAVDRPNQETRTEVKTQVPNKTGGAGMGGGAKIRDIDSGRRKDPHNLVTGMGDCIS